jgi:hypothetical protein
LLGKIDDARIDKQLVIHAATVKKYSAIRQLKQMGVQGQTGEAGRKMMEFPTVGSSRVDLKRLVVSTTQIFRETGSCQDSTIAEGY